MTLPWSGFSTISHWQLPSCSMSSGCAGDSNSCVYSNVCTSTSPAQLLLQTSDVGSIRRPMQCQHFTKRLLFE